MKHGFANHGNRKQRVEENERETRLCRHRGRDCVHRFDLGAGRLADREVKSERKPKDKTGLFKLSLFL